MTPHATKERHVELHRSLDELLACYLEQTGRLPHVDDPRPTIAELMEWSHQMTIKPTCIRKNDG